jgi:hypothetical protein
MLDRRTMLLSTTSASFLTACGEVIDNAAIQGPLVDVTILDDGLTALEAAFNASHQRVRLLFIVGPSCGPCLRGLMEMNTALGADLLSSERLRVLIVHVPTLGAQESHARRAAQLLSGSNVTHYWDPSGESGDAVQEAVNIQEYAWDVWLTYAPGPTWDEVAPPPPATWSHQLGALPASNRLNPEAFATDVRARVEQST